MLNCTSLQLFDYNSDFSTKIILNLFSFKSYYQPFHKYISVILCLLGIITNNIHIWVLSRKQMRFQSVHIVLIFIASADIGTMLSYLIYIIRFEFFNDEGYAYKWTVFLHFHASVSIALHGLSIYLVVFMAFIRCQVMKVKTGQSIWMLPHVALLSASVITLTLFILSIPTYLAHEIVERTTTKDGIIKYTIIIARNYRANDCVAFKIYLWVTGILIKAVPCFLLMFFTLGLLKKLRENQKKRNLLFSQHTSVLLTENTVNEKETLKECNYQKENNKLLSRNRNSSKRQNTPDRTNKMLLLMVTIFLITELPQGICAILNALFTQQFHEIVYSNLADVLDLLSLINCFVAFIVYTSTCSRYRRLLLDVLKPLIPKCLNKNEAINEDKI
ncbi:GPCR, rhodopsin-like, 7TM domain and 7TM GPCR, serpentine receptor class w (Srw) family-containing protein [Strongyloides ratti]|uniref:GPCR, rhodopsin-like, 7TM domain and 7TM GPCR, serpentine receptor class w (Srw) family-containing protein n=1 Tax=Strongyloides ratti TaxID=34506 RepID=A0A090LSI9_STRRB|nr:GPCR, rhodopsin-like, 7TM domain and 7TM GPCR, serpentine receptor class w (Srw) family-containing protein [Strongyloides ratti]CEF71177.1 GPCR, rhodopsin-like, 7TM domain and 7TM GPCR, serpentine receptor class w (Srw) family-containing protein [Strongyloides ratti]